MDNQTAITIMLERIARLHMNGAHAGGLKPVQWEVLRYLERANRFSRTPSAVRAYLGITKGTVSQTIIALEKRGFVKKGADPKDKRAVRLELTDAGRVCIETADTTPLEQAAQALPFMITEATRRALETVMNSGLNAAGGRSFGVCAQCRHFTSSEDEAAAGQCNAFAVPLMGEDASKICRGQEQ